MAHIHTADGQHDLTVSMYIIRTDFDQPKLLLHKHKKLNTWLQFGGHVELNENPWQALEHEMLEETGYELSQVQLLQPKVRFKKFSSSRSVLHPQPAYINTHPIETPDLEGARHFHIDVGYVFVTEHEPAQPLAEDESSNFILVTRDELEELGDEMWKDTREICRYVLDTCMREWERVVPPTS